MIRLFKKYFIPHERNDHQPHILRWEAILVILSLALVIEVFFLTQVFIFGPFTDIFSSILPTALTDITNLNRQNDNLLALDVSPILQKAAQLKTQDMADKGYFAHRSPEGLTPWYWLAKAGYKFVTAGENLAINFVDSQDVANAWMNSPSHRANILNNNFTEIGIATAKGVYKGQETVFIAQFFGRPKTENIDFVERENYVLPIAEQVQAPTPQISLNPAPTIASEAPGQSESFALVMGESQETQITPAPSITPIVPSEPIAKATTLTGLQKILSQPRTMANYLFIMLFTIVALALVLKVFIKIKIQHPPLIFNGLLALLIISFTVWLNQFLSLYQAKIF